MFSDLRADAVRQAANRLHGIVSRTPLTRSERLSDFAGGDVFLKRENEQVTGSFKIRGAFNAIASLPEEQRSRGVIAASAGNHGLGVAMAAQRFRIPATIFVPRDTPGVKRDGIRALGATVDLTGANYDQAHARAVAEARERGMPFIDPCQGADLLAGQGTVGLEVLEDLPNLGAIIVPVGGGGLVGGIASLLRSAAPSVTIIGVQSERTAAMMRSLEAGSVVPIPNAPTLAEGLAGQVDDYALDLGRHAIDQLVLVSEPEIALAIRRLYEWDAATVEGAGAVGAAAIIRGKLPALPAPIGLVLSGGNIDPDRHTTLLRNA